MFHVKRSPDGGDRRRPSLPRPQREATPTRRTPSVARAASLSGCRWTGVSRTRRSLEPIRRSRDHTHRTAWGSCLHGRGGRPPGARLAVVPSSGMRKGPGATSHPCRWISGRFPRRGVPPSGHSLAGTSVGRDRRAGPVPNAWRTADVPARGRCPTPPRHAASGPSTVRDPTARAEGGWWSADGTRASWTPPSTVR